MQVTEIAPDIVFDALGSPVRRWIVRRLRDGPVAVHEIAAELPISRPAVSRHLRVLGEAGLVAYEAVGNAHHFHLRAEGFERARAWLGTFWEEALLNLKTLVEEGDGSGE
jgi:DNA-binding transcriptional ArsR family regulator